MNRPGFLKTVVGTLESHRPVGDTASTAAAGRLSQGSPTKIMRQGDAAVASRERARHVAHGRVHTVAARFKPAHEPLEIHGIVHGLTPTLLLVMTRHGEVQLTTDESTLVVIDGEISTPAELVIGERVRVDALPMPDGAFVALLVVGEPEELEMAGSILCLTDGALTLEAATGIADIGLTDETVVRIVGHDGSLSDLRVGMHVEVRAERLADGRLYALVIRVEDDFDLVELEGVIVSVSLTEIVLRSSLGAEVAFAGTEDTFVMRQAELVPLGALRPGDHVAVKAFRDPRGVLVALRIKVRDHPLSAQVDRPRARQPREDLALEPRATRRSDVTPRA